MRRLYDLVVLIGLICSASQIEAATKYCAPGGAVALDGVVLRASPGNIDRKNVTNPFVALTAQEKAQGRKGTFCWLTLDQSSRWTQCSAATPRQDRTNVFELERCVNGESVPLHREATSATSPAKSLSFDTHLSVGNRETTRPFCEPSGREEVQTRFRAFR